MKLFFENWRKHLSEDKNTAQVLREVDEEELGNIQTALEEMEPTDLAFNHLFGDKMRRIIDFDTVDKSTGLGKLVSLWPEGGDTFSFGDYGDNAFKWVPDFSTGTVSRLSPNDYIRKAGLEKRAIRDPFGAGLYGASTSPEKEKPKKEDIRRETMKIGKFLSKGERLAAKHEALDKQLEDAQAEYDDNIRLGRAERDAETRKKMNDLQDQQRDVRGELFRFVSHDSSPLKPESWQELAKFWQQNADYLKNNPEGANSDTYKIILSRHPIDILRMSDFRQITSCHKPPSHPKYEGPRDNYYQCAVAEAHGQGAMAYVVQKDTLFSETGTKTIEEAEKAINEAEEVFYDERRPASWEEQGPNSIGIIPNSRVRLRKLTYHQPEEWKDAFNLKDDAGKGTQFALPEKSVYGARISGIVEKVKEWALENQAEQIKNFPRDKEGKILFNRFIKSGGTYEDNTPTTLMQQMFPEEKLQGKAIVDDSIEQGLDLELGGYNSAAIQQQIDAIAEENKSDYFTIEGEIQEDDYDYESYYITAKAQMIVRWPESEWKSLHYQFANWILQDLDDLGVEWADADGYPTFAKWRNEMVLHIPMDTDGIMEDEVMYDVEMFEAFAEKARGIARQYNDFVKSQANRFARREGMIEGGVFTNWGWEIINGDADYYDWEVSAQEGDDVDIDSIEIYTQISIDDEDWAVLEAPALEPEYIAKIMNTDDFKTLISRWMFTPIFNANPDRQKYYSNRVIKANVLGKRAATVRITFDVYGESNDEQVENLKDVIEYWDDEERQMNLVLNIIGKLIDSSGRPEIKESSNSGPSSLREHFKRFL